MRCWFEVMLRVIIIIFIPVLRVNIIHLWFLIASCKGSVFKRFFCLTRLRLVEHTGLELYFLDLGEALLVLSLVLGLVDNKDPHWSLASPGVGTLSCVVVLGGRPISEGLVASDAGVWWTWWSCT